MKYISTRGGLEPCNFSDVLLMGTAPDGGLTVPERIPTLTKQQIQELSKLSYPDLAFEILRHFIDDIPQNDLKDLIQAIYSTKNFSSPEITPVNRIKDGIFIGHLSEGPTYSFKDLPLQLVIPLMEYVLKKNNSFLNIVAATSGDTGSATEVPAINKKRISVMMLTPHNKMSPFQTAQMYSINEPNIKNLAVHGVFDTCQSLKKEIDKDQNFKQEFHIGAANSINWARIACQIVYHFKTFFATNCEEIDTVIPSGNFGHALSAYYAKQMGLPLKRIIVATNENNVLHEFFSTGVYKTRNKEDVVPTNSPSMDIAISSNLERFLFDIFERDPHKTRIFMEQLTNTGIIDLSFDPEYMNKIMESGFVSGESTDEERINIIKELYDKSKLIIDPHTAAGCKVALELKEKTPLIFMETAKPFKFNETIEKAIGHPDKLPVEAEDLMQKELHFTEIDPDVEKVKDFIRKNTINL